MSDDDWLEEPAEDTSWLDEPVSRLPVVAPGAIPTDVVERAELVEDCWQKLDAQQKLFLEAYRDCHFNARAAERVLHGTVSKKKHAGWMHTLHYATVAQIWEANAARSALNPDRLLRRQDEIVETALTPKPVLYQGIPVIDPRDPTGRTLIEEVNVGAASRANEVLLDRAMPKNSEEKTRVVVTVVRLTGEQDPDV
jgi:hypothetical protein